MVFQVLRAQQDQQESLARREVLDIKVHQDKGVQPAKRGNVGSLDPRAPLGSQVVLVSKDLWDQMEIKGNVGQLVLQAQTGVQEHQGVQDRQVL